MKGEISVGGMIIVVALIVVLAVYAANDGQLFTQSLFLPGFSTLSLSQVDFTSNDPDIGGQAWVLTVVQSGASQSAFGNFVAKEGSQSSDSFSITTELKKNRVTYPVQTNGQFIRKVEWEKTLISSCSSLGYPNGFKPSGSFDTYCYRFNIEGVEGTINAGTQEIETQIMLSGKSGTTSCSVTNTGATSCNLGTNGRVNWQGNLVSGQSIPSASGQGVRAVFENTFARGWKTVSESSLSTYRSYDQSGLGTCLSSAFGNPAAENCLKNYNTLSSNALVEKPFVSQGGTSATLSGTQSNGQIVLELGKQIQFPVLTFKIKAAFIGINEQVGQPKLVSVTSQEFKTGTTGFINAEVKNTGTGQGSFDVFASCSSPFSQTGSTPRLTLSPGQTSTAFITISGTSSSGTISSSCTVTAQDIAQPNNKDTKTVVVKVSEITLCSQGDKRVNGNSIEICESNSWVLLQDCGATKTAQNVNGQPMCVEKQSSDGSGCGFLGINCVGNIFDNFTTGLITGLIVVVGALILFIFVFIKLTEARR